MPNSTIADVASNLKHALTKSARGEVKSARFGYQDSGGLWQVAQSTSQTGYYQVTLQETGPTTFYFARLKLGAVPIAGNYVRIRKDDENVWEVVDNDGVLADAYLAPFGGAATMPDFTLTPVGIRRIGYGLGSILSTSGMFITVAAFHYDYGATQNYFAGGTLDLTGNVPSAGYSRMVKVCVNPTTNALSAINGTDFASGFFSSLGNIQLAAIPHADLLPIVGVRLIAGQVALTSENDLFDCRRVASFIPSVSSIAVTSPITLSISGGAYTIAHADSGVSAGTYTKLTVDIKGHVTSGTTLVDSDIPNLDASKITSGVFDNARVNWASPNALGSTAPAAVSATAITGSGVLNIDSGVLYVDTTNNRVGVNTITPSQAFEVTSASGGTQMRVVSASGARGGFIVDTGSTGQQSVIVLAENGVEKYQFGKNSDAQQSFFLYSSAAAVTIYDYYPTSNVMRILPSTGSIELGNGTGYIKFFDGTGSTRPSITGSRGGNAALASFLTALATMGLIIDSTTA